MSDDPPDLTILTEYFYPEEASTAQLLTELAQGLTGDFDVSVVTALPSYHATDRDRRVPRSEVIDGVNVRRVRGTRFDKDRLTLRLLNWLSFTFLASVRLLTSRRGDDVRLVLSNPPILPIAAWLGKRLQGVPYVYVVYDVYPEMPVRLGHLREGGFVARTFDRLVRLFYRDADRIVVLGDAMESHLRDKFDGDPDVDAGKIEVIHNWEDPSFVEPRPKSDNEFAREHGTEDTFTLLYSGNIGLFHELETAIDAIRILESRGRDDIQFLVIGEGAAKPALRDRVRDRGIENVSFLPFQPLERLPETLTCGDASLVGVKPEVAGLCVSSKLYSSLAAGRPILAVVGDDDEVARVVRDHECGAWVEPGDHHRAADVLERWADDPDLAASLGRNARETLEQEYRQDRAMAAYRRLFAAVSS